MNMDNYEEKKIGDLVAQDFRTAAIFSKYGIDFCCKGHRTISEVCNKKNIDSNDLVDQLKNVLSTKNDNDTDYKSWPSELLIDYIERIHHAYVTEKTPVILQFLDKLCKVHGERHPELFEINNLFLASTQELAHHMKKEELILFPFIKNMENSISTNENLVQPNFGSVNNPIAMMMHEHDNEGERFRKIALLTNNYTPPADACNTYRVTFAMIQEFEQDLHKHIHLENNILFPKAKDLEQKFQIQE
jgi:regulator of cell morphogenesis and NO signaling